MKAKRCAWAANPKKAVAYLRISTTKEQQELGVSAQRAALESWAARDGFEICEWFVEEVSGGASLERRPILLRAIAALGHHGAGLLVVQRLDRFSRDPLTAAMAELQVQRLGARVVSADGMGNGDDPGSRLMRDVGLAAARFERAMIAARTKAALGVKKARGECMGTPPYGFRVGNDGKTLVANEAERDTARRLCELRERGWSYRQVRAEAKRLGMTSRARTPFTLRAVFDLTKGAECGAAAEDSALCRRPQRGNKVTDAADHRSFRDGPSVRDATVVARDALPLKASIFPAFQPCDRSRRATHRRAAFAGSSRDCVPRCDHGEGSAS